MDGSIPLHLERELELIGVLNRTPLDDHDDLPQPNVFEFKHIELDENGEPPW